MSDQPLYIDLPVAADQRIDRLYVWIATFADGSEGIVSADLEIPGIGRRHMPLFSSKRHLAEQLEPLARKIQREAMHKANRITRLQLRHFVGGPP